ncbi:hypothetical protein [Collimonas pratensis]|uniref:hypothetical protein n=1 Tax=Collimonas pratensis TaxID=279113 RepID=UPI0012E95437|nr:hypothetical protein [Collimonas pratensis]
MALTVRRLAATLTARPAAQMAGLEIPWAVIPAVVMPVLAVQFQLMRYAMKMEFRMQRLEEHLGIDKK